MSPFRYFTYLSHSQIIPLRHVYVQPPPLRVASQHPGWHARTSRLMRPFNTITYRQTHSSSEVSPPTPQEGKQARQQNHKEPIQTEDQSPTPGKPRRPWRPLSYDIPIAVRRREKRRRREASLVQREGRREREHEIYMMFHNLETMETKEQVPLAYATDKAMSQLPDRHGYERRTRSRTWCQKMILENLGEKLEIVKVRNRWVCSKEKVDQLDLGLWWWVRGDRGLYC